MDYSFDTDALRRCDLLVLLAHIGWQPQVDNRTWTPGAGARAAGVRAASTPASAHARWLGCDI